MPSPPQSKLPVPHSPDEFEDMVLDILREIWGDPMTQKHGRSGQAQQGVDIYGRPSDLGGEYAGAQCKNTRRIDITIVSREVAKAVAFTPPLKRFVVATTAPRDAVLQEQVRNTEWPFQVDVLFWEDLSGYLAGDPILVQKYYRSWLQELQSLNGLLQTVYSSGPSDYKYDTTGRVCQYRHDVRLRILLVRDGESASSFPEAWALNTPSRQAKAFRVRVMCGDSELLTQYFVDMDEGRYFVPYPISADDLRISRFQYQLARIVNEQSLCSRVDEGLLIAGVEVDDSLPPPDEAN